MDCMVARGSITQNGKYRKDEKDTAQQHAEPWQRHQKQKEQYIAPKGIAIMVQPAYEGTVLIRERLQEELAGDKLATGGREITSRRSIRLP